jgi:demethylmenaquinone methyltransferase / 2-methoxy-6-polyprenyl-1,4-benzoquinol methylase
MPDKTLVKSMFDEISPRYDLLNHLLSFGIDRRWRKQVVKAIKRHFYHHPDSLNILDVATGTGDLALAVAQLQPKRVEGIDISDKMMDRARVKVQKKNLSGVLHFQEASAEEIPFDDNQFDVVMVAFGVRNFDNLKQGLIEMYRVLKPGGIMLVLEFSHPNNWFIRQCYKMYSVLIPPLGRFISNHDQAYTYLPETVRHFPYGATFVEILHECGAKNATCKTLTGGIASLYMAEK